MSTGLFYTLRAKRHQKRYTARQTHHVHITIELADSSGILIVPTPLSNEYQTVTHSSNFEDIQNAHHLTHHIAGEYMNYWEIPLTSAMGLERMGQKTIELKYEIQVQPRIPSLETLNTFTNADYALSSTDQRWIQSATHLQIDDPQIQQLIHGPLMPKQSVLKTVAAAYAYIMKQFTYGNPIRGLYSSAEALKEICVDCGGYDTALVTLLRASGIPARIVSGYWAGYNFNDMHAWVEFMLPNNEWIPLDPSVHQLRDQKRSMKSGGFGWVGSDRIAVSVDCDHVISVSSRSIEMDIMQTPVLIEDNLIKADLTDADVTITPLPYTLTTRRIS